MKSVIEVHIIESERGWGQKLDEVILFNSPQDADDYCTRYNSVNDKDYVPDWYMRADVVGIKKVTNDTHCYDD